MDSVTHRVQITGGGDVSTVVISHPHDDADYMIAEFRTMITSRPPSGRPRFVGLEVSKSYKDCCRLRHATSKVALLTLCQEAKCLIIQLHRFDTIPGSLAAFLELPEVVFCSVGINNCLDSLRRDYGLVCRNAVDFNYLPTDYGYPPCLPVRRVLSCDAAAVLLEDKWDQTNLTNQQISHLTNNAYSYWSRATDNQDVTRSFSF